MNYYGYYLYFQNGLPVVTLYGPFASEDLLQGWLSTPPEQGQYLGCRAWTALPAAWPVAPNTPQSVPVGNWTVVGVFANTNGTWSVYCYGSYATEALALAAMVNGFPPTSFCVAQVLQPGP